MKFEIQKGVFLETLQIAQNAIPNKTTLQVLNNFLFRLEGNQLFVTATDLDLSIVIQVEVKGLENGSIVINAKKFLEVIRELPDLPVMCSVDEYVMTMKSETGFQCNLSGFDSSEYPSLPIDPEAISSKISPKALSFLYSKTFFAVSNDLTTRINLTGVYLEHKEGMLTMVGTDGHRLGKAWVKSDSGFPTGIILPPKAVSLVLKCAVDKETEMEVKIGTSNITFYCGPVTIVSKLVEGPYPDYQRVIPQELSKTITLQKEQLISVLRRVATMAHTKTKQVKFTLDQNSLLLSAKNQDIGGDSEESMECDYHGKAFSIGFNSHFVLDVLKLVEGEKVRIKMNSSLGATLFESDSDEQNYFFIIMPLRLMEDE